jgi:protein-disulfide isomerase
MTNKGYLQAGVAFAAGAAVASAIAFILFASTEADSTASYAHCFLNKKACEYTLGTIDNQALRTSNLPPDLEKQRLEIEIDRHQKLTNLVYEASVRYASATEKGRGVSLPNIPTFEELIASEVTPESVKKFYDANKQNFAQTPFIQVESMLKRHLEQQQKQSFLNEKLLELKNAKRVVVNLPLPSGPHMVHAIPEDSLTWGNGKNFQILFVNNYNCGPCRIIKNAVESLATAHPTALTLHEVLVPAPGDTSGEFLSMGAHCAKSQQNGEKFASYHNIAASTPVQYNPDGSIKAEAAPRAHALAAAQAAGLDADTFEACLQNKNTQTLIDAHRSFAAKVGAPEAPALFVNGKRLLLPPQENVSDVLSALLTNGETPQNKKQ